MPNHAAATMTEIRCPHCQKLYGRTDLDIEILPTRENINGRRNIEIKCECKRFYWVVSR